MENVEIRSVKPARDDRAFLGFYTTPQVKGRVLSVADHYGVSVSELLATFAEYAPILCWFVPLGEDRPAPKKESRQLAG